MLVCFQSLRVKLKGLVFVFWYWVLVQFIEGLMYYIFIVVCVPIQFRADKRVLGESPKTLCRVFKQSVADKDWLQ